MTRPPRSNSSAELKSLEEKTAAESEAARVKAAKTPIVSLGSTGLRFSSADTNFTVTLKGLIQTDSHTYFSDNEPSAMATTPLASAVPASTSGVPSIETSRSRSSHNGAA